MSRWFVYSLVATGALAAVGRSAADDAAPATTPPSDRPVIVLEPSDDPNPPPVVIGTPRPDGTGRVPGKMVDFTLTDQLGREVTNETLLGRPWVANFIFSTCPTHCPATLAELYQLQRRLRDTDVRLVTITVDPATDTVEKLHEVSKAFGADPKRWLFLTGDPAEIQKVIRDGFQQTMMSNPMALAHSLNLMHVDESGQVIGKYRFHFQEPEGKDELNSLRQVLLGQIETPEKNRFVPKLPDAEEVEGGPVSTNSEATSLSENEASTVETEVAVPAWVDRLRTTNAMLNALATILLLAGFGAIKAGKSELHKRMMLFAFGVSVAFLASYLTYHGGLKHYTGVGHKPYAGAESLLGLYRGILWTHIALAAVVPVLAIITIRRGLKQRWEAHRKIAKITFPIWLYVSVTGVVIYFMNAG